MTNAHNYSTPKSAVEKCGRLGGKLISIKSATDGEKINDPTHIGYKNPFRYRGYYYDTETGMYYLQSRYYNPEWGRFLNADVYVNTGTGLTGTNMYAYCDNNPVMKSDPTGFWSYTISASTIRQKVNNFFGNMITRYVNNVKGLFGIFAMYFWPMLKPFIAIPVWGWVVAAVVAIVGSYIVYQIASAYVLKKGMRFSTSRPFYSLV